MFSSEARARWKACVDPPYRAVCTKCCGKEYDAEAEAERCAADPKRLVNGAAAMKRTFKRMTAKKTKANAGRFVFLGCSLVCAWAVVVVVAVVVVCVCVCVCVCV